MKNTHMMADQEALDITQRLDDAIDQVVRALEGKRHGVVFLEDGMDEWPYLDVTIDDHPYRLILEDHGD